MPSRLKNSLEKGKNVFVLCCPTDILEVTNILCVFVGGGVGEGGGGRQRNLQNRYCIIFGRLPLLSPLIVFL